MKKYVYKILAIIGGIIEISKFIFKYIDIFYAVCRKNYYFPMSRGTWLASGVKLKHPKNIEIGQNCVISKCIIGAHSKIVIGNDVTISEGAVIETAALTRAGPFRHKSKPILISDGAWIATNAIVLGGSIVRKNELVPAGSVRGVQQNEN